MNTPLSGLRIVVVGLCAGVLIGGCPQETNLAGGTTATNALTTAEEQAATAGLNAGESIVGATNVVQGTAQGDTQSALDTPGGFTIGTCPEVTFTPAAPDPGATAFSIALDFGAGCYPAGQTGQQGVLISGSAVGTFDTINNNVTTQFDSLNVNGQTLDGNVDLTFGAIGGIVSFSGGWSLNYKSGDVTYSTVGEGAASYDGSTKSSTIGSFTGTIEDGTETYTAQMSGIVTSYATYGNTVPSDGRMTLSGSSVRTTIIEFDGNSPVTGVVQVSVDGGPFFEWTLSGFGK